MINQIVYLNSKKVAVYIPSNSFSNELVEIESIAQKLGQYGNILGFQIRKSNNKVAVIFSLQEDYRSFKTSDFSNTNLQQGDKYFDTSNNQVYEVEDTIQTNDNKTVVQVKQPNTQETKLIDKDNLLSSTQKVESLM